MQGRERTFEFELSTLSRILRAEKLHYRLISELNALFIIEIIILWYSSNNMQTSSLFCLIAELWRPKAAM